MKQKQIANYCKQYREFKKMKINDIRGDINYQTLSSFEKGLSSNMKMLTPYLRLAKNNNEANKFLEAIGEMLWR